MEDKNIKTIHTYLSDMADAVRENEGSVIKIALAEQSRKNTEELFKKAEGTKTEKILLMIGGVILITASVFGIYYFYKKNVEKNTPVLITKSVESFFSYNDEITMNIADVNSSVDLIEKIKNKEDNSPVYNSIRAIFLTNSITDEKGIKSEKLISTNNFLSLIKSTMPLPIVRSLSEEYMLGTYTKDPDSKMGTFLIFETNDYSITYAKLLEWEKSMANDFFVLFRINITNDNEILSSSFKDVIINNKDVRILYDSYDNPILYYLFIDKTKFIITDSEDALREILARLIIKNAKTK